MRAVLLAALFASSLAGAAPAPRSAPYWLKIYSTAPWREFQTGELTVKDLGRDLPKILSAIEKNGGVLTQPLETFPSSRIDHSQQLSFSISQKGAAQVLKAWRKFGRINDPAIRSEGARIPLEEVREKIARLSKERRERSAALGKVPAAAEAADEILAHLLLVEKIAERTSPEVRFNLQVRQE